MSTIKAERIAYLAGYFEARGFIIARARLARRLDGAVSRNDGFGVSTSGPLSLIEGLRQVYGGTLLRDRQWRCFGADAARFLAEILPHVVHRREEIEAGLDFYRSMAAHPREGSRAVPPAVAAERVRLAARVAALRDRRKLYAEKREFARQVRAGGKESVA
jgi:hypothetical protein